MVNMFRARSRKQQILLLLRVQIMLDDLIHIHKMLGNIPMVATALPAETFIAESKVAVEYLLRRLELGASPKAFRASLLEMEKSLTEVWERASVLADRAQPLWRIATY